MLNYKLAPFLFFFCIALFSLHSFAQTNTTYEKKPSAKFPGGTKEVWVYGSDATPIAAGSTKIVETDKEQKIIETTILRPNDKIKSFEKQVYEDPNKSFAHTTTTTTYDLNNKISLTEKVIVSKDSLIASIEQESWVYDELGRPTQHAKTIAKEGEGEGTVEITTYNDIKDQTGVTVKKQIHFDWEQKHWVDDFGVVYDTHYKAGAIGNPVTSKPKKSAETQPAPSVSGTPHASVTVPPWLVKKTSPVAPGAQPKQKPAAAGELDPCLVGSWRSEPVGANMLGVTGGDGIVLTFKADGTQTIDYNGMQPFQGGHGDKNFWTGTAEGHIATNKGTASVQSVERSDVMHKHVGPNGTHTNPLSGSLGPAGLGNNRLDPSYECNETRLTFKDPGRTFVFFRQK